MEDTAHHIGNYRFEVKLLKEESAREVQERLMQVIKLRLIDIVERVFDDVCPEEVVIRIPGIELDLGELDLVRIESELEYNLRVKLQEYLLRTIEQVETGDQAEVEVVSPIQSKKELIKTFLTTGILPWWAPEVFHAPSFSLIESFEEIHMEDPQITRDILLESVEQPVMLHRLIAQLGTEDLLTLINYHSTSAIAIVRPLVKEIKQLYRLRPIKKYTSTSQYLEKIFWKETIKLVIAEKKLVLRSEELLLKFFTVVSQRESIDHVTLMSIVHTELQEALIASRTSIIATYIEEQYEQLKTTKRSVSEDQKQAPENQSAELYQTDSESDEEKLQYEADTGSLSEPEVSDKQIELEKRSESDLTGERSLEKDKETLADQVLLSLSVGEVSLQDLFSDWSVRSRKLQWIEKLTEADVWAVVKSQAPTRLTSFKQIVEEMMVLVEEEYWRHISVSTLKPVIFEIVLDGLIKKERQHGRADTIKVEELVKQFLDVLSKKLSLPTAFIEQAIQTARGTSNLSKVLTTLKKQAGTADSVDKANLNLVYDDFVLRHFFVFGIYPVEHIPSIEEYTVQFAEQFPQRLEQIVKDLTPGQMVRLVMRINREFSEKTKADVLSRIQAFRTVVINDKVRQIGRISLDEMTRRADDTIYFIRQWLINKEIEQIVTFSLNELVESFIRTFSAESKGFFETLPSADLTLIFKDIEIELEEAIIKLVDGSPSLTSTEKPEEVGSTFADGLETTDEKISREPLYIKNAGLVILYPFLSRYFKLLNLLSDDRKGFKDEYSVQRAVHLLHFLVYGQQEGKEYEMTLNKLMCGMPFAVPVEKDILLTKEEIETSEGLLQGAIQNWDVIKSSSISNFRGSFLIRDGRLRQSEQAWSIKVEERAYDMLLDKIPWSFKLIRLPWMKKAIHVDWR
ncbi:hypothetical protein FNH22_14480 [Fulvivirga sp. M361]|uniref:contractile injection system tape measure protein n=1 Tax=Fulvivirga sp. M361 TaxID=2594266 RepID=UPI00117BD2BD|nr:contractile injection system tape measure protein [Fulvivirga sp. M361]TRX58261.1 hypothetical protein FNH22_14480 [Fulvivirga sp. M361]